MKKVIAHTNVLIINDEEALQLSQKTNLIDAAIQIQTMGPSYLIIKKGEKGAVLFSNDQVFESTSFIVDKCMDPTGAGDTFAGAFIGHLNNTDDLSFDNMKIGVIKACAMASFCVESFGVNNIINKEMEEINKRISSLEKTIS